MTDEGTGHPRVPPVRGLRYPRGEDGRGGAMSYGRARSYFWVYVMASRRNGTLYVGVTSDLPQRVWQHQHDIVDGFTKEHRVHDLVWWEQHETILSAIAREKKLKKWPRTWKIQLIEQSNPHWHDLAPSIILA